MQVIKNKETGLYWSNDWGWGSLKGCAEYSKSEVEMGYLNLPIDGEWVDKPAPRKFYRTVYKIELLSEEPTDDFSLGDIFYEITEGHCSGVLSTESSEEIDGRQAAAGLARQGSEPGFFLLDEDGNDIED